MLMPHCVRTVCVCVCVGCHCRYMLQYQENIPCEQLVMRLCDHKQAYTQFGGTCLREGDRPVAMMKSFILPFLYSFFSSSSPTLFSFPSSFSFLLFLSSLSSREASVRCVHPLHGVGSSPWFPTLPE